MKLNKSIFLLILALSAAACYILPQEKTATRAESKAISRQDVAQNTDLEKQDNVSLTHEVEALLEKNETLVRNNNEMELALSEHRKKAEAKAIALIEKNEKRVIKDIKKTLNKYKRLFEITTDQERKIAEWAEEKARYKRFPDERTTDSPPKTEEKIKTILSDEQLEIYQRQEAHERDFTATHTATRDLHKYPVTLKLTEDQKSSLYQNLYKFSHSKSSSEFKERYDERGDSALSKGDQRLIWAAEGVLSKEQNSKLLSHIQSK